MRVGRAEGLARIGKGGIAPRRRERAGIDEVGRAVVPLHEVEVAVGVEIAERHRHGLSRGEGMEAVGEHAVAVVDPDAVDLALVRLDEIEVAVAVEVGQLHEGGEPVAEALVRAGKVAVAVVEPEPVRLGDEVGVESLDEIEVAVAVHVAESEVLGPRIAHVLGLGREVAVRVDPGLVRFLEVSGHEVEIAVAVDVADHDREGVGIAQGLAAVDEGPGAVVVVDHVGAAVDAGDDVEVAVAVDVGERHRRRAVVAEPLGKGEGARAVVGEDPVGGRAVVAEHDIEIAVGVDVAERHAHRAVRAERLARVDECPVAVVGPDLVALAVGVA